MGTRCITIVREEGSDNNIMMMYRHCDGFPSGHGKELYDFVKTKKLVNGLSLGDRDVANGAGCLAAQIVAHFKDGPGHIYLCGDDWTVDYTYVLYEVGGQIGVRVNSYRGVLFEGTLEEFGHWVEIYRLGG